MLFQHVAPPSVYKSSCPLIVGGGGELAFGQASALPVTAVAGLRNKATCPFLPTLVSQGLAFERRAAGPGFGNKSGLQLTQSNTSIVGKFFF